MDQVFDWGWVQKQVAIAVDVWDSSASPGPLAGKRYSPREQRQREQAYDDELQSIEQELRHPHCVNEDPRETQQRLLASFARFSAAALNLEPEMVTTLTDQFVPVAMKLAQWARRFDAGLSMAEIIQASRNAWTACGLQPLLGMSVGITPSILGYSLLYPYSDNYLDQKNLSGKSKLQFSKRFRRLLLGENVLSRNHREHAIQVLIALIESQYPRTLYPQVFDCLLAIHQAQEESLQQVSDPRSYDEIEMLKVSCGKGGSSVVADACLVRGWLSEEESRFAFDWGVLLQLGDDLQDLREDMLRGSSTLFSRAATAGEALDDLAMQLLNFGETAGACMDRLPHGSKMLKKLLKMSWRSLIIRAVADSHQFFSAAFVLEAERLSPFRFGFLRARQERLTGPQGLYSMLFNLFLRVGELKSSNGGPDFDIRLPQLYV